MLYIDFPIEGMFAKLKMRNTDSSNSKWIATIYMHLSPEFDTLHNFFNRDVFIDFQNPFSHESKPLSLYHTREFAEVLIVQRCKMPSSSKLKMSMHAGMLAHFFWKGADSNCLLTYVHKRSRTTSLEEECERMVGWEFFSQANGRGEINDQTVPCLLAYLT